MTFAAGGSDITAAGLGVASALVVLAVVALVLAVLNRRARRWRFGVFYERDDRDDPG